jgi:hypothetical protein
LDTAGDARELIAKLLFLRRLGASPALARYSLTKPLKDEDPRGDLRGVLSGLQETLAELALVHGIFPSFFLASEGGLAGDKFGSGRWPGGPWGALLAPHVGQPRPTLTLVRGPILWAKPMGQFLGDG